MNNYIIYLKNQFNQFNEIRTFVYLNSSGIKYNFSDHLINHKLVLGLDDYSKFTKFIQKFNSDKKVILSKAQEYTEEDFVYLSYTVVYENKMLDIVLIENYDITKYLKRKKNFEIVIDKEDVLYNYDRDESLNYGVEILDSDEFIEEIIDFYINLVRMAISYKELDYIKTSILKSNLNDIIIKILNLYISVKYDNKIVVDNYGQNLEKYLENDFYNSLKQLLEYEKIEDTWTYIFKIAQLYRRVGLSISEKNGYIYPKKEDVETLEYLRKIYNESL